MNVRPVVYFYVALPERIEYNKSHTKIERGVSCGGTQVPFYQFWSSDAKDTPAYLNGQINGSSGSGCLNLKFLSYGGQMRTRKTTRFSENRPYVLNPTY